MPHIRSNPDTFVDDALEGLARAHADLVRRVEGGIVRAEPLPRGHCAVVIGGGSGHYPAFAGLVGDGLAAGAVCGEVFTSPSAGAAERVALAAHAGGGVLFSYGNYAGDVIHFGQAERRLREQGVDCRTVLVTDDVASAPADAKDERRGIAGDFVVFKVAGALAAEGASIDEVEAVARHANSRTVTMGVAFDGCVVPGGTAPLFSVPEGMMSMGLGIHGEPGVSDVPVPTVDRLAADLVAPLLAEKPADADGRVGLIVNGLGTVKYEELFVLLTHVWDALEAAGLSIAVTECGELVTSLDMAGASVTVTWLDDQLARLWKAPAATPAYRRGAIATRAVAPVTTAREASPATKAAPESASSVTATPSPAQRAVNDLVVAALTAAEATVRDNHERLGALDAVAGDGDHGTGMMRGIGAALAYAREHQDSSFPRELLRGAAEAWSESAGGTSGALWAAALEAVADSIDAWPGGTAACATAAAAALDAVRGLGKAQPGDKTMVDAMAPYTQALREGQDKPIATGLEFAAHVATQAAVATAHLEPKKGRARPLAARSVGHADPGATSFALIATALARVAKEAS